MNQDIEALIKLLAKVPGFGPRSARRATLHLMQHVDTLLGPLQIALKDMQQKISRCLVCGNIDTKSPCQLCTDPKRDNTLVCVVESIADVWALERSLSFKGRYHILGGVLSALEGIGPDQLNLASLWSRLEQLGCEEVILALPVTLEGQTTGHYIRQKLATSSIKVTALAQGIPLGAELDYLDDGTLMAALATRRAL